MTIGQRLKEARLAAGLSQRQLCGETITRNMLSQIENGVARPSMETLQILAKRLGRPVSYFLEEGDPAENARQAFREGAYDKALEALEACDAAGDECNYLMALSCLRLAEEAVSRDRIPYALTLLENCAAAAAKTAYFPMELERRRLLLLAQAMPERAEKILADLKPEDMELLLRAEVALQKDAAFAALLLDGAQDRESVQWCVLRGRAAYALGRYKAAAEFFHRAEAAGQTQVYSDLEQCYRQLEDFKMAYYYACKQK